MAMILRERVIDRLQSLPDSQQTARELAQWVFDEFPDQLPWFHVVTPASQIRIVGYRQAHRCRLIPIAAGLARNLKPKSAKHCRN
ncbi:hypothetical protein D3C81_1152940 [compost metagenome]|jgi:hypothetical protein